MSRQRYFSRYQPDVEDENDDSDSQINDICERFESIHNNEINMVGVIQGILRRRLGERDWEDLDGQCLLLVDINEEESGLIGKIRGHCEVATDDFSDETRSLCQELQRHNERECEILTDLKDACERGDAVAFENRTQDLERMGLNEGDVFNEIEAALSQGDSRDSRKDDRRRGDDRRLRHSIDDDDDDE